MLGHPTFLSAQIGAYAQSQALLSKKNVAAVSGIDGPDGVIFRKMRDILFLFVYLRFGMQASGKISAGIQFVDDFLTYAGHDGHTQNDVNGIGKLNTDFSKLCARYAHGKRDGIHGSSLHGTVEQSPQFGVHLIRSNPVVGWTRILFLRRADYRSLFVSRYILGIGAIIQTARQLLLVQFNHFACFQSNSLDLLKLFFAVVEPDNIIRLCHFRHFFYPIVDDSVRYHCHKFSPFLLLQLQAASAKAVSRIMYKSMILFYTTLTFLSREFSQIYTH